MATAVTRGQPAPLTVSPTAGGFVPPVARQVVATPGKPLDAASRSFMEPRFGHDFSKVRIHTDAEAVRSAAEVRAAAYTVGQHVVFGRGQYDPSRQAGKELLAHELTHTLQQKGRAPRLARQKLEVMHAKELLGSLPRYIDNLAEGVASSFLLDTEGVAILLRGRDRHLIIPHSWFDWNADAARVHIPSPKVPSSRQEALGLVAGLGGDWYTYWDSDVDVILPTYLSPASTPRIAAMVRGLRVKMQQEAETIANEMTITAISMLTLGVFRHLVRWIQKGAGSLDAAASATSPPKPKAPAAAPAKPPAAKIPVNTPPAKAPVKAPAAASGEASLKNRPAPKRPLPKEGETPEQYYDRTRGTALPLEHLPLPLRNATVAGAAREMQTATIEHLLANPNGIWTHYLTKGGYVKIMRSQALKAGTGQNLLGQGDGVRAVPGPFSDGAGLRSGSIHLDFKVTKPPVPGAPVPFGQMGQGAKWKMTEGTELPIQVVRVSYLDGSHAKHLGGKRWQLTTPSGTVRELELDTLLSLGDRPTKGLALPTP